MDASDFGASFKGFLDQVAQAPAKEGAFVRRLREHFGADATTFPIVSQGFEPAEHANVQVAIDALIAAPGRSADLAGCVGGNIHYGMLSLAEIISPPQQGLARAEVGPGPVQYANVMLGEAKSIACVNTGLYFISGEPRLAVLVVAPANIGFDPRLRVEVMAGARADAERFLADVRRLMRERNVYRGRTISLSVGRHEALHVEVQPIRAVARDEIVLPQGVLERIERETVGFARHVARLRAAGRHVKRGILLHGPPGTGKTLTAMHLASRMTERSVLVVTGQGLGLLQATCRMARTLEPSLVIIEDVDLIAEERTQNKGCSAPLLFELMNQMDGLGDDCDVTFVLTTNRPDLLEPALSARPGRIDLAVEVPLPDAACRARLIDLYGRGLDMRARSLDRIVARTEGASAAFMRELLRKAALYAASGDGSGVEKIAVEDGHIDEALRDLAVTGGMLTRSLLGFRGELSDQSS